MEIHSSSLSFFTASGKTKNKRSTSLSSPLKKGNKNTLTTPTLPNQVKILPDAETSTIQNLSNDLKKQQHISSNLRNSQALYLYTQENTQSLQKQRVDLISKIDFFI